MEKAFQTLLGVLDLSNESDVYTGKLVELEVEETTKQWNFVIEFEKPLEIEAFKRFIDRIEMLSVTLDACSGVAYAIDYATPDYEHLKDYYHLALKRLQDVRPRYHAMSDMDVEQNGSHLKVVCPQDGAYVESLLHEVESALLKFGFDVSLSVRYCEASPTITERIEQVTAADMQQVSEETPTFRFESFDERSVGKITHTISDVPVSEDALNEYKSAHRGADVTLEGRVDSFEKRDLRKKTTLYTFVLKSDDDAVYVKKFVRDKGEATFLDGCEAGMLMRVQGYAQFDQFTDEVVVIADKIERSNQVKPTHTRQDDAETKRVELHLHSKMSTLDGINSIEEYVKTAKSFGHEAIALTDHDNVQAFPEFYSSANKAGIKPIYGAEISVVDEETTKLASGEYDGALRDATYVVFDIETTGLSVHFDDIIEISAIKIHNHQVVEHYDTFVNPKRSLSDFTKRFTGISQSDVDQAPDIEQVITAFKSFCEGAVLVAHNAPFDVGHIERAEQRHNIYEGPKPFIDTLQIARQLYSDRLKRFNLKAVAKAFKVDLDRHHRAESDTRATKDIFLNMLGDFDSFGLKTFADIVNPASAIEGYSPYKNARSAHVSVLVQTQKGLKNLFKLVSLANTDYFDKGPKLPKKVLQNHREGLLIGSGCMNSDFFETALNMSETALQKKASFFDYLEIQPYEDYLYMGETMEDVESRIETTLKRISDVSDSTGVPLVASGDVHHIEKDMKKYRDIYVRTPIVGGGYHALSRYEEIPAQYFRTTQEMLESFPFFSEETTNAIVIDNPRNIAARIENVEAFNNTLYAPTDDFMANRGVPSIEKKMLDMVYSHAKALYGDPLPALVQDRLDKEMQSITKNKFSTVYYISHLLVKKSLDDGYLVGSRGSVGSSFVATLMDITEVNPLPPHYVCSKCHFSSFKMSPEEKNTYGVQAKEKGLQHLLEKADSGFDLPSSDCPRCGASLKKEGHDIPFETFLGFKGDKVPDIDLNFSGDYQGVVHEYIRELFGRERAFRAGTISTVASKTAFGYVRGYAEKKNLTLRKAEIERRANIISGVKRSTGQHPGGIVVVPSYKDIYDVTPVQYPADDTTASWKTTHFDYHAFEDNLFKLDVLGHDDPTMIRYLMDFVKQDPISFPFSDARDIPLDDPQVYKMLSGTDVLHLKPSQIRSDVASYGVPEMGTSFVRGMLKDSRPQTFADIVKISGLSHGTDVWLNNAEMLVTGKTQFGQIPFSEVIGCRDDIMVYLIQNELPAGKAFEISEFIRKGKAQFQPDKWEDYKETMRRHSIPEWYIWSAGQIKYMFPKAHATAYVIMALRIAWFKLYRPIYFYSAYFSKRAQAFDLVAMQGGEYAIERRMDEILEKGNKATDPEKKLYTVLEVALEMVKRGYHFKPVSIQESQASDFTITSDGEGLRLPFLALDGLGRKVADSIVGARDEKLFTSREDVKNRTALSTTLFNKLEALDAFGNLPDTSQMNLFDL